MLMYFSLHFFLVSIRLFSIRNSIIACFYCFLLFACFNSDFLIFFHIMYRPKYWRCCMVPKKFYQEELQASLLSSIMTVKLRLKLLVAIRSIQVWYRPRSDCRWLKWVNGHGICGTDFTFSFFEAEACISCFVGYTEYLLANTKSHSFVVALFPCNSLVTI